MGFNEIPDDVWIEIFESVDDTATLAKLIYTCRRFRSLANNLLLRDLRWSKIESAHRNFQAWGGNYSTYTMLPRKLTMAIPFDFSGWRGARGVHNVTREMGMYDDFYRQLPLFTNLREFVMDGTVVSQHTYNVLQQIPTLRSLTISNCTLIHLPASFAELRTYYQTQLPHHSPPPFAFAQLPITHLSLHKINVPSESDYNPHHPLHLITAQDLSSLNITWTGGIAMQYAVRRWLLPSLEHLEVSMPLLTRDLIDSLINFVGNCALRPRIALSIERHNLSDQQLVNVHFPLKGVYKYKGPLPIASFGVPRGRSGARYPLPSSSPSHSIDDANTSQQRTEILLEELTMNEPLELSILLNNLEMLPSSVKVLELQVRTWDIELLFAVRQLFPDVSSLVVLYGMGTFPEDFFVTLGASILFDLPKLHTLKLVCDVSCATSPASRHLANFGHPLPHTMAGNQGGPHHGGGSGFGGRHGRGAGFLGGRRGGHAANAHTHSTLQVHSVNQGHVMNPVSNPHPPNHNALFNGGSSGWFPVDVSGNFGGGIVPINAMTPGSSTVNTGGSNAAAAASSIGGQSQGNTQLVDLSDLDDSDSHIFEQWLAAGAPPNNLSPGIESSSASLGAPGVSSAQPLAITAAAPLSMSSTTVTMTATMAPVTYYDDEDDELFIGDVDPAMFGIPSYGGDSQPPRRLGRGDDDDGEGDDDESGWGGGPGFFGGGYGYDNENEHGNGYDRNSGKGTEAGKGKGSINKKGKDRARNYRGGLEQGDLKDYLIGWNRYCKKLRHVQLERDSWWERRWEGGQWVQVYSPRV